MPFAEITGCAFAGDSPTCVAITCQDGYFLLSEGAVPFCVPLTGGFDCSPCAADEHCTDLPDGQCTALPDEPQAFCTRGCVAAADCDSGYECSGGRCVPVSGSCSCLPQNAGDTRTCFSANDDGSCFGTETCDPSAGWSECDAPTPIAELCDGEDNDCDGIVDEDVTHDPPECTAANEFGTCAGAFVCAGAWVCDAAEPIAELCDLVDNDCDGGVDEEACVGAIPNATAFCAENGGVPRCEVQQCDPGYFPAGVLTCLPAVQALCQPCVEDANCATPGDQCLALDGGAFCGRDCSEGNIYFANVHMSSILLILF